MNFTASLPFKAWLGLTVLVTHILSADLDNPENRTPDYSLEDSTCIADQPSITHSPDLKSVWFKVLSTTGCKYVPTIIVYNFNTSQQVTLSYSETVRTYKVDMGDFTYTKNAYFYSFPITKNIQYSWRVQSGNSLGPFTFGIRDFSATRKTNLLVIADSDISERGMPTLNALMKSNLSNYDGLVHVGDFAYDIENENGARGDNYFNKITPLVTQVPYLVVAGNHEWYDNIRLFNYRFKMPGAKTQFANNVYLFKLNNILFAFVNYDLVLRTDPDSYIPVMRYLDAEFAKYQSDGSVRWRVVVSHRPIYCGLFNRTDCTVNLYALKPFEELYRKYKVDVRLESHEHIYERIKLLSNNMTVLPLTQKNTNMSQVTEVTNPSEQLAIICGLAGNIENLPLEGYTFNINYKDLFGVLSYLDLSVTDNTFESLLIDSISGQVLDGIRITKSPKTEADVNITPKAFTERRLLSFSWNAASCNTDLRPVLIEVLVCFVVLLLLAYIQNRKSRTYKQDAQELAPQTVPTTTVKADTVRTSILESDPPL